MRPELRKLSVMPTPRWTAAAVLLSVVVATVMVALTGPGDDGLATAFGLEVPVWIAAIVIGVWVPGMEYGQKTMRRTLTRNPNRLEVVGFKLATVLIATVALTAAATLVAAPLFALASIGHDSKIPIGDTLMMGLGGIVSNSAYAVAGFAFGLATRSMAGGMTIALAFFFVVDSLLTSIPKVGDFMLSAVSGEIYQAVVGNEIAGTDLEVHLIRAIALTLAWLALFVGLSSLRFVRTDAD